MSNFQPTRFGKYLLLEKLATGGMAQLYRAKIIGVEGFEKFIAIKQILPHLAHEEELITSFIDEAKLAALLNHQNVVQIYDFGSMENSYFITMEFLFGKDLRAVNAKAREKGTPVSLENALYLISKVCAGLDYAHKLKDFQGKSLNIIHRDISPQNVFLTYEGDVKIVDFGIAKAASQSTITQVGMIKGKVAYMSPEQAAGKVIDHRSDIFATGILLYELVAGGRMFKGDDTLQILSKVREAEFTPLGTLKGGLPEKLYDIAAKALAKDPEDRYQSCADMQADIEECIFRLNLRPSGRTMAEYLKLLFAEEIEAEGQRMANAATAGAASDRAQEVEAERRSADKPPAQKTPAPKAEPPPTAKPAREARPKPAEPAKGGKKGALAAVAGVAVLAILGGGYFLMGKGKGTADSTAPAPQAPAPAPAPIATQAPPQAPSVPASAPSPAADVSQMVGKAVGLIESNPAEAKAVLQQAIAKDPRSVQAHFQLGHAYVKLKEYPKALEAYAKAAEIDAKFADAFFNMGYVHAVRKEYAKAEKMYAKVVTLSPMYVDEALFNLGMVQEKQGKRKESLQNIEKSLSINPGNEPARKALARMKGK
ncbi:MAG: protein kinase [bacterium]|jgi:tetratricopeptide (TPR) repeat protein/tRNA A-37 threonylcarbamoyl transferase component Bud32